jgi:hypothetical protein
MKATYSPATPATCKEKDKSDAIMDPNNGGTDAINRNATVAILFACLFLIC